MPITQNVKLFLVTLRLHSRSCSQCGAFCVTSCPELISHRFRISSVPTHDLWTVQGVTERGGWLLCCFDTLMGGIEREGGFGRIEGQTDSQSRRAATPVRNQHLYPSSLAAAKHCERPSHLFVHPQKCSKPLISTKTKGKEQERCHWWPFQSLTYFCLLQSRRCRTAEALETKSCGSHRSNKYPLPSETCW